MDLKDNPSTCIACRLRAPKCVCAWAPRLSISTRLIVLIHSKEWRRTTNTGHFARLAIDGAQVQIHGSPRHKTYDSKIEPAPSTLVLYPGRGARPLTGDFVASLPGPLTLIVPDGNWNQAQHMMRRLPMLSQAHPVRLEERLIHSRYLRQNRVGDRMSTFEAIAQALAVIENEKTGEQLLQFFHRCLESMYHHSRRAARAHASVSKIRD